MARPQRMLAGDLRHRVQIYSPTETRDAHGGVTVTWTLVAVRFGNVVPLSGRELVNAQQVASDATHKVTLRYDPTLGITTSYRLIEREKILNIVSAINPDNVGVEYDILCTQPKGAAQEVAVVNDAGIVAMNDSEQTVLVGA